MKPIIAFTTLVTIFSAVSYGSDGAALKAEIIHQSEQKKAAIEALEAEVARQRLILQALEARLQAMKKGEQSDSRDIIEIKIEGSSYTIDGKQTDEEGILSAIQAKAGDDKSWPVVIRFTTATPYEQLQLVLQACAKGGFHNVALVKPTKENG